MCGRTKFSALLIRELIWRDFHKLGTIAWGNDLFKIKGPCGWGNGLTWVRNDDLLQRWINGATGYPFVDAHMRELKATGYTLHLGREVVAWFMTSDLRLDWRLGAEWFESVLVDYDCALNWGNWVYFVLQQAASRQVCRPLIVCHVAGKLRVRPQKRSTDCRTCAHDRPLEVLRVNPWVHMKARVSTSRAVGAHQGPFLGAGGGRQSMICYSEPVHHLAYDNHYHDRSPPSYPTLCWDVAFWWRRDVCVDLPQSTQRVKGVESAAHCGWVMDCVRDGGSAVLETKTGSSRASTKHSNWRRQYLATAGGTDSLGLWCQVWGCCQRYGAHTKRLAPCGDFCGVVS